MAESFARFAKSTLQNGFAVNATGKYVRSHSHLSPLFVFPREAAKWFCAIQTRAGIPRLFKLIRLMILNTLLLTRLKPPMYSKNQNSSLKWLATHLFRKSSALGRTAMGKTSHNKRERKKRFIGWTGYSKLQA